jgi:diaminohydroxyphosphoribosylaminopyrimidine deaminase / 5-amino-6-(5-phosphoribosylamino)uracil reductase
MDGKIATSSGNSRWITGPAARHYVHLMRNRLDAVMVGIGTVLADNPRLTCRIPGGRDPCRIILDGRLRIPLTARVLHQRGKTVIVTGSRARTKKLKALEKLGAEVWRFPLRNGGVPLASVLKKMAEREMASVMIEGGAATAARALAQKVVDKIYLFYAPKIVGGDGVEMIAPLGVKKMNRAMKIKNLDLAKIGEDLLVTGYL